MERGERQFSIRLLLLITTGIAASAALAGSVTTSLFLQVAFGLYFAFIATWVAVRWRRSHLQLRRRRAALLERRQAIVERALTAQGQAQRTD